MANFQISIIPAANGDFTAYINKVDDAGKVIDPYQFCGSLQEIGRVIGIVTTTVTAASK